MSKAKRGVETDVVLRFLTKENRPFSVQNIVDALQKEGVKKTAVEKALATLVETGKVTKKEYGKAKIFLLAQDTLPLPDPKDAAETDDQLKRLTDTLSTTRARILSKRERATTLKSQFSLTDATSRVAQLDDELKAKTTKRTALGDGSLLMSKADKQAIDQAYYDMRALWKKYKTLVKAIVDQIGEGTGKRQAELHEEIGVETDEDVHMRLTDFPDMTNPAKTGGVSKRRRLN